MDVPLFLEFISRVLSIVMTLSLLGLCLSLVIGIPYCRYIHFLTLPNTEEGDESFARYLAKITGGRGINVDETWQSFIPAAKSLKHSHLSRKNNNNN